MPAAFAQQCTLNQLLCQQARFCIVYLSRHTPVRPWRPDLNEMASTKPGVIQIEWEHIVPAWTLGHQRQCWQSGGRRHCIADDPVFRAMEADLFNLYPAVGEVNADRSNFQFGMVRGVSLQYGTCTTKVDFKGRAAEPRDQVKGLVARVSFYMHDRYGLNMSRQQQQLLMAWDRQYLVSEWEKSWSNRTATAMGHPNPFVNGERS
tara:strand:- start:62 stop:676 length:615 start_codon:yes stop_codon:yes gene_type:complete